jgi:arabinose-5-phosphate isomerase
MSLLLHHKDVIHNAQHRSENFLQALSWYTQAFQDLNFQEAFLNLSLSLTQCDRHASPVKQAFFLAVGKSAGVSQISVSMLVSVGILARFVHPTEALHGDFGVFGKGDVVVFVSYQGQSAELLQLLPGLKERGAQIFALTSQMTSPLAKQVPCVVPVPFYPEACPLGQSPITSPLTTLALCQLLVAATVEVRQFPLENYAKNHPGGAIGRRIFLRVSDILPSGQQPVVSLTDGFPEVVSAVTRFSKGGVLVLDQETCVGLIAEKDLRLAMETKGPDVFVCQAQDIMNPNPVTLPPHTLALEALRLMTRRHPPLSLLPIVDDEGKPCGLLRLHDIVSAGVTLEH